MKTKQQSQGFLNEKEVQNMHQEVLSKEIKRTV
jgi:hypothetical protein